MNDVNCNFCRFLIKRTVIDSKAPDGMALYKYVTLKGHPSMSIFWVSNGSFPGGRTPLLHQAQSIHSLSEPQDQNFQEGG